MSGPSDFEANILSNVEKRGCSINFVFDPDQENPDFAYSIGFPKTSDQDEVIVFGLPREFMLNMINEILRQIREENLVLEDGLSIGGLLEGHQCIAREISDAGIEVEYFASAIWYRSTVLGGQMSRAFQIVWPGATDGLFPWDDGADEAVIESQPALYEKK